MDLLLCKRSLEVLTVYGPFSGMPSTGGGGGGGGDGGGGNADLFAEKPNHQGNCGSTSTGGGEGNVGPS